MSALHESQTDARRQAEVSADIFERMLRAFVNEWAPKDSPYDRDRFQMDLTRLMVQGMRHQSSTYRIGLEHYSMVADQLNQRAMAPLVVITKPSEEGK